MAQVNTPFLGNKAQGDGQNAFVFGAERNLSGHESFAAGLADGDTVYYIAKHSVKEEWEYGLGTWDEDTWTLARTAVLASSAGGTTKTTFSKGAVEVTSTILPAKVADYTVTNLTPTRSISGTEATAANIAAVVATLVNDLITAGVLK